MHIGDLPYAALATFDHATGGIARAARAVAAKIDWYDWQPGRPTVLCLERALFNKDIAELRKRTNLNLPGVHVKAVKLPQEKWVAPRWRRQSKLWHDLNTHLSRTRRHLEEFGVAFLEAASARHPIDAVAAANTDYWQDEALRMGCRKLRIAFVVLSRESYGIGRGRDFVSKNYHDGHFYFDGTGCAVASETCRQFMLGQPAMRDATIEATGWPRYDAWRDYPKPELADRKLVTMMAYGDPAQLQYAAANFRDVLQVFCAAAERQRALPAERRLRFSIKMKKRNEDGYIRKLRPDLDSLGIDIVADTPLPELVTQSRAIIGYNTLAVLEGLLGGSAVIVPVWADSDRDPKASLLHPDNPADAEVCYFPRSVDDLDILMRQVEAGTLLPKGSPDQRLARFSRHSLVDAETTASMRVEAFVRSLLS